MKYLIYNIKRFFFNLKQYFNILLYDEQFDYAYLLELEQLKLKLLKNCFIEDKYHDLKNQIKWINTCIKLIDIILENDEVIDYKTNPIFKDNGNSYELISIGDWKLIKYVNSKNYYRFLQIRKESDFWFDELRKKKALYLYHKIRYNYIYGWWN